MGANRVCALWLAHVSAGGFGAWEPACCQGFLGLPAAFLTEAGAAAGADDDDDDDDDDEALWDELDLADEEGEEGEEEDGWEDGDGEQEQQREQQQGPDSATEADAAVQRMQRQAQEGFARLAAKGFTGQGFGSEEASPAAARLSGPKGFGSISPAAGAAVPSSSALRVFRCAAGLPARQQHALCRASGAGSALCCCLCPVRASPTGCGLRARLTPCSRYAVDAPRVQRAIQDAGLQQRVVQVEELKLADAVLSVKLTPSGKHINLRQAQETATNAGIPLVVAGRSMTGGNLLRSLQPMLSARSSSGKEAGKAGGKEAGSGSKGN
jgi:hypothetical protein